MLGNLFKEDTFERGETHNEKEDDLYVTDWHCKVTGCDHVIKAPHFKLSFFTSFNVYLSRTLIAIEKMCHLMEHILENSEKK